MATADNTALGEVPEESLREVVRRIVETAQPEKIILFGSAATGRMGPNSDLDFCVIKGGSFDRGRITQEIYHSLRDLEYAKDVIVVTPWEVERYKDCPALIVYPVLREGKVLYERKAV